MPRLRCKFLRLRNVNETPTKRFTCATARACYKHCQQADFRRSAGWTENPNAQQEDQERRLAQEIGLVHSGRRHRTHDAARTSSRRAKSGSAGSPEPARAARRPSRQQRLARPIATFSTGTTEPGQRLRRFQLACTLAADATNPAETAGGTTAPTAGTATPIASTTASISSAAAAMAAKAIAGTGATATVARQSASQPGGTAHRPSGEPGAQQQQQCADDAHRSAE